MMAKLKGLKAAIASTDPTTAFLWGVLSCGLFTAFYVAFRSEAKAGGESPLKTSPR